MFTNESGASSMLYELRGSVALLTLNRPDKLNAFTSPMVQRWAELLEQAESDPDVRVIVVTGSGRAFCTGGDTQEMGGGEVRTPLDVKRRLTEGVQRVPLQLDRMAKPVIAAINGLALGAGLDLALMCDIRFASAGAKLGETYARVGLVPGAGGAYFLPRLVGTAKALEMFWTSDTMDAAQAMALGLVNQVCPDEELLSCTMAFAQRVAAAPPLSVQLIKRMVRESMRLDLRTSLKLVSSHMTLVRNSEDHAEAIAALREKRPGRFRGR